MSGIQRIAIIGAGAAGLCAARHVGHSKIFEPVVFELTDRIGGTWFYTDEIDKDENGYPIQSSMYKDLKTNLPKQVMAFPDFQFDSSLPSFLHHDQMFQYLQDYAAHFQLHQYVKLNTVVNEVNIVPGDEALKFPRWRVKTYNWDSKISDEADFDGVIVCNGLFKYEYIRCSTWNIPSLNSTNQCPSCIHHVEKEFKECWVIQKFDASSLFYNHKKRQRLYDALHWGKPDLLRSLRHYAVPNMPTIEGMESFKGKIMHSHRYRRPHQFVDQNVVLFGGLASGTDIALLLSKVAKNVWLSHKGRRIAAPLPTNFNDELPVTRITEDGVIFENGKSVKCDCIMFCTGYSYSFPFFKDEKIIQNVKNRITPLYKHALHIHHPNLSFIGLCVHICPFPQFHCQVLLALSVLDGSMKLPSTQEMLKEQCNDYEKRVSEGLPVRGAHILGDNQWAYNDELADMCGKQRIPEFVRMLYDMIHHRRLYNLQGYKEDEFKMSDKGHFYRCDDEDDSNL